MPETQHDITVLLKKIEDGESHAQTRLIEVLYQELKMMAARNGFAHEQTLSPTVLVHDAYIRLMEKNAGFRDRFHFLSSMAVVMRNLVIDYVRQKGALKRGGEAVKISLEFELGNQKNAQDHEAEALFDGLSALEKVNPRQARYLELKYFAGMTLKEISQGFDVAISTVHKEIKTAQAWLYLYLTQAKLGR